MNNKGKNSDSIFSDFLADTRPSQSKTARRLDQELVSSDLPSTLAKKKAKRRNPLNWKFTVMLIVLASSVCGYFLLPGRTNILILGVDDRAAGGNLGRTDTMILLTVVPSQRFAGMLSIPRDLWVPVAGYGENRINTIHFFAEAAEPGSGARVTMKQVESLFGLRLDYYVRLRFDSLAQLVDDLGGVEITFDETTSGYPAGTYTLSGNEALAFVRDRENSDDFGRMQRGQMFVKALMKKVARPQNILRLVAVAPKILGVIDTDAPLWLWPRIAFPLLFPGGGEVYSRTVNREMVTPFTTADGAQVLSPNWGAIQPLVNSIFYSIPRDSAQN